MHVSYDFSKLSIGLVEHLRLGFTMYSISSTLPNHKYILNGVSLWHDDQRSLMIYGQHEDISPADWLEMGYLAFDDGRSSEATQRFPLPDEFRGPMSAVILIATDDAPKADIKGVTEAGIELIAPGGGSIIIAAGSFPYSTALQAAFFQEKFDSEYDLVDYERVPLLTRCSR